MRLLDLEHAKTAVLNSLTSSDAQRGYRHAIDEFVDWYCSEPRLEQFASGGFSGGLFGADAKRRVKLSRLVNHAIFDNRVYVADVAHLSGGVAIDENHVGTLARSDGTEVVIEVHDLRGFDGGDAENFGCGNSGFGVNLQFTIQGIAIALIGPSDDLPRER